MIFLRLIFVVWIAGVILSKNKSNYVLSPQSVFVYAITLTYIIPSFFYSGLNINTIFFHIFLFLLSFIIISKLLPFPKMQTKNEVYLKVTPIYVVAIGLWTLSLLQGLPDYSLVFDRMINPRDYTYIRSGSGVVTFLSITATFAATYIAANRYWLNLNYSRWWLANFLLVNLLGGGKASIFSIFFIMIFSYIGVRGYPSLRSLFSLAILSFLFLIMSFGLYSQSGSRSGDILVLYSRFLEYQQEYFMADELMADLTQQAGSFFNFSLVQTLFAPVPRFLFEAKLTGGLYEAFLNQKLNISDQVFHFQTPGFFIEGILSFGHLWSVIYALIAYLFYGYLMLINGSKSISPIYMCWMFLVVFGLVRAGFLFTTFWMVILIVLILKIYLRFLVRKSYVWT